MPFNEENIQLSTPVISTSQKSGSSSFIHLIHSDRFPSSAVLIDSPATASCATPNIALIFSGALGRLTFERARPAPTASFRPLTSRHLLVFLSILLPLQPPPTRSPSSSRFTTVVMSGQQQHFYPRMSSQHPRLHLDTSPNTDSRHSHSSAWRWRRSRFV